jgi:predicted O-methyltransferase YrrM
MQKMKPNILKPTDISREYDSFTGPYSITFDKLGLIFPGLLEQPDLAIPMPLRMVNGHVSHPELTLLCHFLYWTAAHNGGKPVSVLEIGTFDGNTARAFASVLQSYNHIMGREIPFMVYTLDLPVEAGSQGTDGLNARYTQTGENSLKKEVGCRYKGSNLRKHIVQLLGDSMQFDATHFVQQYGLMDFVFVDANHDYDHTHNDQLLASAVARKGALILQHDYARVHEWPGVTSAVETLAREQGRRYFWLGGTRTDLETTLVLYVK